MRILIIKMSSMGDVFHIFPALSDLKAAFPEAEIDWIVEEGFAEIPRWHSAVNQVWPIGLRRWRKTPFSPATRKEARAFFQPLADIPYDLVIDAQGLLKSVWVARHVSAPCVGLDWHSVREKPASWFYERKIPVPVSMHAILRLRLLFARALDYPVDLDSPLVYGLDRLDAALPEGLCAAPYMVFIHGTTWETKFWPETHWQALIAHTLAAGRAVVLPWGTDAERERSLCLAQGHDSAQVWVPHQRTRLVEMASIIRAAEGVVSVDTGLAHVAAALDVPMAVLYRVTDPSRIGALGPQVVHLASPEAPHYVKRFASSAQEARSLENLAVEDVLAALIKP